MDMPIAPTLETKEKDSTIEHASFSFETPHVSRSLLESPGFIVLSTTCPYEDPNHFLLSKLFRKMVVDTYVYHKYSRSHGCTVILTLQLEH
jgi:hypothetical protein